MNKIIKPLCLALSACLLLFSSSACANKDDGVETIQVNEVTHSIFYAPLYLADSLGYFAEEDIKIELTNGGGADNVMSAVLSGDSDIGFADLKPLYTCSLAALPTYQPSSVNLPKETAPSLFRVPPNPTLSGMI